MTENSPLWRRLRWLLSGGGPLKEQVMRGGIWLLIGDGATKAAGLLKLAILGRLLSPNDFGLMGIAIVILNGLEYFTQTGVSNALIQRRGDIRPYLDTAWTVQVLRSVGLAMVLLAGAPLGAWFFGNAEATSIIRAVSLVTLFRSLANPAVVYLRKELDFHRDVMWRLTGVTSGLIVAVPLALAYRNAWALVLSVIAAQATETLASYFISPYRPRLRLEWARARELMGFGKWIFWSQIVDFLGLYIDSVTVGRVLGTITLGFYQMAHQLAMAPTSHIGSHVHGVLFPAFSKLQDERDLRRASLRALALVSAVVLPIGCFLSVFADLVVRGVLGSQWTSITPALRILAWAGVATAVSWTASALCQAAGKPNLPVRASILKLLVLASLLYPLATSSGTTGVALAVATSTAVAMVYHLVLVTRLVRSTALETLGTFRIGAVGSLPFVAVGLASPSFSPSLFVTAGLATAMCLTILFAAIRSQLGYRIGLPSSRQS